MTLTLVAHIFAKADQIEPLKFELTKLIAPTLLEEGCITYDLHQDNEDPTHFMFFENWQTRELWQDHLNTPHIKKFQNATKDAIDRTTFYELTQVASHVD